MVDISTQFYNMEAKGIWDVVKTMVGPAGGKFTGQNGGLRSRTATDRPLAILLYA
jgi:hypothetical protein